MVDTMKPEIQEYIEVEPPSKPAAAVDDMAGAAYCATAIANIEGWRCGTLPSTREGRRPTLEQLDARVRRLESMSGIHPPPPMDAPLWDSLAWRVARLHRKMPTGPLGVGRQQQQQQQQQQMAGAAPPHIVPTEALLRSTVASLGVFGMQSWDVFVAERDGSGGSGPLEGFELVCAAAQYLAYLAGKRGHKLVGSFDLDKNCRLALDLSLEIDAESPPGPGFPVGPPFPHHHHHGGRLPGPMPPPPPPPRAFPMRKGCCGCCSCVCHGGGLRPLRPRSKVLKWMTGKYDEERRASRTGVKARVANVFRKLAFWRRRDSDSDTCSISTRTSSTFT